MVLLSEFCSQLQGVEGELHIVGQTLVYLVMKAHKVADVSKVGFAWLHLLDEL